MRGMPDKSLITDHHYMNNNALAFYYLKIQYFRKQEISFYYLGVYKSFSRLNFFI